MICRAAAGLSALVASLGMAGCSAAASLRRLDPPGLPPSRGLYTHVVVAEGSRLVFVAGQVALDSAGRLVGPNDLSVQAHQVYGNVTRALRAAGATWDDVVKTTTYLTGGADPSVLLEVRRQYVGAGALPANTLLQVSRLAREGLMVEVEAIAVLRR